MKNNYDSLKEKLDNLLSSLNSVFTKAELLEVEHFIENNEFGLAFETLCDIIVEEKKDINSETYRNIKQFGSEIGIDHTILHKPLV